MHDERLVSRVAQWVDWLDNDAARKGLTLDHIRAFTDV